LVLLLYLSLTRVNQHNLLLMKKRIIVILKYLMFLGLGVFLVWWSLQQIPDQEWGNFKAAFATARYWLVIPVFLILTVAHAMRAWRWKMLMEPLGYKPTFANTFFAVMIGYLANLAVPRLGEILKCTILAKYEKVPAEKLVGTIVAERAFDLVSLILVFILAFLFQYDIIGDYGTNMVKGMITSKSGNISYTRLALVVMLLVAMIAAAIYVFKKYRHIRFVNLVYKMVLGIWHGIISVKDLQKKWQFIFASIGIWGLYLLGTWVGFYATVGTSGLGIQVALSALAFASIGMIITPGGIGAYALFLANVLQLNGISFALGFANGTLQWFAQFIIIILVGFISLGLLPYFNKTKHNAAVA